MTLPRFDSHQHFWRLNRGDYHWLGPDLAAVYRDFMPGDLKPLLDECGVQKTVVVQAAPTLEETRFLLSIADKYDWIAGVVGWVDMECSSGVKALERLEGASRFVGVRPMIQDIPQVDWMLKPELSPVFNRLEDNRLAFDALVQPRHLAGLALLLTRHPRLKVVIDHGGKPTIGHDGFDRWAEDMKRLADHTRAVCKLSGLLTGAPPGTGEAELRPYVDHLLDCFGPSRLLWGSDWPVLNLAGGYRQWVELCENLLAPLSEPDRRKIWYDNAAAFYLSKSNE